jgi:phage shock protein A
MALITRISRLFTADVHAVLDRIEEPEVVLKQAVREMADDVARSERRLRWLADEHAGLSRQADEAAAATASLDEELDLCFAAGEENLARGVVKRKLMAEERRTEALRRLEANGQERETLEQTLTERRDRLSDMQQKAELFERRGDHTSPSVDAPVSRDAIEVAFLREKQRRQS